MFKYLLSILILISGCNPGFAQNAPDVVVNAESTQGSDVENQNFNNLYQQQQQIQNQLNALTGNQSTTAQVVSAFNNGILQPAAGGTGQNSSAWTSGDVVYMSSQGVWGHQPISSFNALHGTQIFTTSGTFTAPMGVSTVLLSGVGGGAGGGGCGINTGVCAGQGGGGGGGAAILGQVTAVTGGSSYSIVIGAGGAGGTTTNDPSETAGGNGGSTTAFGGTILGGTGGGAGNGMGGTGAAGAGGTGNTSFNAGGGPLVYPGGTGGTGATPLGGGSYYGTGGLSSANGLGYGAAGGGSNNTSNGGNGTPGIVIIQY